MAAVLWAHLVFGQGGMALDAARRHIAEGRFEEARAVLEKSLSSSSPADHRYTLAVLYLREENYAKAAPHLERLTAETPRDLRVWLAMARVQWRLDRKDRALAAAARAEELAGQVPGAWGTLALFYADAGDWRRAAHWQRQLAAVQPDLQQIARAAEYSLRAGEAALLLDWARKQPESEANPVWLYAQAEAQRGLGESLKALEAYRKAISANPQEPLYYRAIAGLLLDHRNPEAAIPFLEQGKTRFPRDPALLRQLGLARFGTGDKPGALQAFLEAIDAAPDSEASYAGLEQLISEPGALRQELEARLKRFTGSRPESPLGWYLLGLLSQDAEGKAVLLERAVDAEPSFWPAYLELHRVAAAAGDLKKTRDYLNKVLALQPDQPEALYALAELSVRAGDTAQARKLRQRHHEVMTARRKAEQEHMRQFERLNLEVTQ